MTEKYEGLDGWTVEEFLGIETMQEWFVNIDGKWFFNDESDLYSQVYSYMSMGSNQMYLGNYIALHSDLDSQGCAIKYFYENDDPSQPLRALIITQTLRIYLTHHLDITQLTSGSSDPYINFRFIEEVNIAPVKIVRNPVTHRFLIKPKVGPGSNGNYSNITQIRK